MDYKLWYIFYIPDIFNFSPCNIDKDAFFYMINIKLYISDMDENSFVYIEYGHFVYT